ncbi:MAG: tautomerase family protein [Dehalococcoidales bacterium]|nr:tautomerase family protein [Dehalococcoidales bacterium]
MVECDIEGIAFGNYSRGGRLNAVKPPPVYIIVYILKSRTFEQKKRIVKLVTTAAAKILNVPDDSDSIKVEITESPINIAHGGKTTFNDPPSFILPNLKRRPLGQGMRFSPHLP